MFSGRTYSRAVRQNRGGAAKAKRSANKGNTALTGGNPKPRFPWGKYDIDLSNPALLVESARAVRRMLKGG